MATNNIGQFTCLGVVETSPGVPIWNWFNPTDFDFAIKNMRVRFNEKYLPDHEVWKVLEIYKIKRWLTLYIELATKFQESYTPGKAHTWMLRFMEYGFTAVQLKEYFEVFYQLVQEKQIPKNIYEPYTYVPSKSGPVDTFFMWTKLAVAVLVLSVGAGIITYARRK